MIVILKLILSIFSLASVFFGRLLLKEYKIFNKDIETKNTSLAERILVNGIIFLLFSLLISVFSFCLIIIFSKVNVELFF
jgi:hypothetical protein